VPASRVRGRPRPDVLLTHVPQLVSNIGHWVPRLFRLRHARAHVPHCSAGPGAFLLDGRFLWGCFHDLAGALVLFLFSLGPSRAAPSPAPTFRYYGAGIEDFAQRGRPPAPSAGLATAREPLPRFLNAPTSTQCQIKRGSPRLAPMCNVPCQSLSLPASGRGRTPRGFVSHCLLPVGSVWGPVPAGPPRSLPRRLAARPDTAPPKIITSGESDYRDRPIKQNADASVPFWTPANFMPGTPWSSARARHLSFAQVPAARPQLESSLYIARINVRPCRRIRATVRGFRPHRHPQ